MRTPGRGGGGRRWWGVERNEPEDGGEKKVWQRGESGTWKSKKFYQDGRGERFLGRVGITGSGPLAKGWTSSRNI